MSSKKVLLANFIGKHSLLDIQGSAEWLKLRSSIIGGSEISIITGDNANGSLRSLIANKCELRRFNGNLATKWGNLFERVGEILFRKLLKPTSSIYTAGSIPHPNIPRHRYSPDGLCVIEQDGVEYIVLLEFKSPFSAIPGTDVPRHYLPQVKAGLCTIDVADYGIFVSNMFRRCAMEHLNETSHFDTLLHAKYQGGDKCMAYGIILFYARSTDPSVLSSIFMNIYNKQSVPASPLDMGKVNRWCLERVLNLHKSNMIRAKYIAPTLVETELNTFHRSDVAFGSGLDVRPVNYVKTVDTFKQKCWLNGYTFIGFLPWKLIKSSLIKVDKDPEYLDPYVDKINLTIDMVNTISQEGDIANRIKKYNELFPMSPISTDESPNSSFSADDHSKIV